MYQRTYLCLDETLTESDRTCAKNGLTTDLSWLVKYLIACLTPPHINDTLYHTTRKNWTFGDLSAK